MSSVLCPGALFQLLIVGIAALCRSLFSLSLLVNTRCYSVGMSASAGTCLAFIFTLLVLFKILCGSGDRILICFPSSVLILSIKTVLLLMHQIIGQGSFVVFLL